MNRGSSEFRDRMACLADESRFRIVLSLSESERCVSDLARLVGLSQSCTTRHLQALSRRGLVLGTRRGKQVVFSLRLDAPEIRLVLDSGSSVDLSGPSPADDFGPAPRGDGARADSELDPGPGISTPIHRGNDLEDYLL